jgi:hypothetical protein
VFEFTIQIGFRREKSVKFGHRIRSTPISRKKKNPIQYTTIEILLEKTDNFDMLIAEKQRWKVLETSLAFPSLCPF